jgi:hypothetical protein
MKGWAWSTGNGVGEVASVLDYAAGHHQYTEGGSLAQEWKRSPAIEPETETEKEQEKELTEGQEEAQVTDAQCSPQVVLSSPGTR